MPTAVQRIVAGVYGISTGIGLLASERSPHDRLTERQRNLVLPYSGGDDGCRCHPSGATYRP